MYFPNAQFVDSVVTKLAPILFSDYDDGVADFSYLGGDQGRAKLESALAQPRQTFAGEFLYPTMSDKAAALAWSITKNHPFVDGNKRAALTTVNLFLLMNGHVLLATPSDTLTICLRIAGGREPITQEQVSVWLYERIVFEDDEDVAERIKNFIDGVPPREFGGVMAMTNFFRVTWALADIAEHHSRQND